MFTLRGFNVFDSLPATSVMVATGNGQQSCLVLTFPVAAGGAPSAYVQGFTKLDIAQGAVASFNTGNPTNPPEAAQLDGADIANAVQAGGNSGPVLTGFRVNPNGNGGAGTVVYDFDKVIPCPGTANRRDPPTPSDFGFYSSTSTTGFTGMAAMNASDGGIVSCNPTGSVQGRGEVEVSFATGAPVSSAVRAFTTFGAVGTLDHTPQSTPVEDQAATQARPSAPGAATINPYIVSVSQSSPGSAQFAITYNETVNPGANLGTTNGVGGQGMPVTAGNICAQLSYGGHTCAKGSANVSGSTVTVTFPAAAQFAEKIVSISDNGGAVDDQSTTMAPGGNPSSVSSAGERRLRGRWSGQRQRRSLQQQARGQRQLDGTQRHQHGRPGDSEHRCTRWQPGWWQRCPGPQPSECHGVRRRAGRRRTHTHRHHHHHNHHLQASVCARHREGSQAPAREVHPFSHLRKDQAAGRHHPRSGL